ncbi:AAA family ATPase [Streptomyces sp. NPDC050659]|uniref:helix-turn-helix transcriptional regulator n=1 Tax=Streptomyces sp. NPDC050659 TaxID=3157215 RepID=UPI003432DB6A
MLLVAREEISGQLDSILSETPVGASNIAVISGPTAMGKSTVLRSFSRRAAASGVTVLSAVSSRDEKTLPYAVLGKLFDSLGHVAPAVPDGGVRTPDFRKDPIHVAREVYAVIAALAGRGRVLITVDDVQHTDMESLRCLQYLANGLPSGMLRLVFAWESQVERAPLQVLQDFIYRPDVLRIRVAPLSTDDIERMVVGRTRCTPSAAAARIHELTGGNPLLAAALLEDGPPCGCGTAHPRGAAGEQPPAPAGAPGARFREAVLICLHRMGGNATRVAHALAMLDGSVNLRRLSRLTGIGMGVTREIVDKLTETGITNGLEFRHRKATRGAILGGMSGEERTHLHHRTAQLLHEEGEPSRSVVRHLMAAGPARHDWMLPILLGAVQTALEQHQIRSAIDYLRFAEECCSDGNQQYAIKARTAALYGLVDPFSSAERFLSLKAPILAGNLTGADALRLACSLFEYLRFDDAMDIVEYVADRDDAAALGAEWRFTQLLVATNYPAVLPRLEAVVPEAARRGTPANSPALRAVRCLSSVLAQSGGEHTIALAEQVLQDESVAHGSFDGVAFAIQSLVYADLIDTAADWCERLLAGTREDDTPAWQSWLRSLSAQVALRRGQMDEAIALAERALAYFTECGYGEAAAMPLSVLVEAHTATGNLEEAAAYLTRPMHPALFETRQGLHYLYARGRHHLACNRGHAALADFLACGERMDHWNIDTPALAPWRTGAAEAWLRIGDRERAARLIDEQLAKVGTGLTRTRGITLRSLAAVREVHERPSVLADALDVLQLSNDRYESTRALVDLSEAYQTLGDKAQARTAARRARRTAKGCHADDGHQSFMAACSLPGSPANPGHSGKSSCVVPDDHFAELSDSERRVAILAASGYSNREISAKIYVTVSTVEQHLTRVYRKLKIRNREELPVEFHADAAELA